MFTNLLLDDLIFTVSFTKFAETHFLKKFRKKHKGKRWEITEKSICDDLARIANNLQKTQQVDQLYHSENLWVFKYDFRVAQTNESPKSSGNRCV
ncbi:MAG: hypothetical protein LBM13_03460, partial [Candidatus Ancillula sp.]|nr:hypothetical protein [Candidatus Ancillula sp.]